MSRWNPVDWAKRAVRNSPWVVMAIALHVIVVAFAAVSYMRHEPAQSDDPMTMIVITRSKPADAQDDFAPPPEPLVRTALPNFDAVELVDLDDDTTYIPTDLPQDLTQDIGDPLSSSLVDGGDSSSTAIGVGDGPGKKGSGVTDVWRDRQGPLDTGRKHGGREAVAPPAKTEKAVLEGFRWLLRHQAPDGNWSAAHLRVACPADKPCCPTADRLDEHYDVGLTGLALLTFLGAGLTHESRAHVVDPVHGVDHEVGEAVKRGLMWLVKRQQPDGSFTGDRAFLYNETLATMALAEVYGLTRNRYWKEPAQRAVNFLVRAQKANPVGTGRWGWRYRSREEIEREHPSATGDETVQAELRDADTSVTAWAVMALKSAELARLEVPRESLDGALAFVRWVTPDGASGLVGYLDPKSAGSVVSGPNDHFAYHTATMSALGMCIRIFGEHDPADPFLEQGARRLVADLPSIGKDELGIDYYYWYYGSLALNQFDGPARKGASGKYWPQWNKAMVEALLALQDEQAHACSRGGWLKPDRWSYTGGPVYATALNVLTLEVYYRYENAFGGSRRAPRESVPTPDAARPKMVVVH